LWLKEGDATTKFFHTHANGRRHKNLIHSLIQDGHTLLSEEDNVDAIYNFFDAIMGTMAAPTNAINLDVLDLYPSLSWPS
jgi:hypothetical protein